MVGTASSVRRGWRLTGATLAILALGGTAACNGGVEPSWSAPAGNSAGNPTGDTPTDGGQTQPPASAAQLKLSPGADAQGVSPVDPVTAAVTDGKLDSVSLTNADNKAVPGDFDAERKSWKNSGELGYDKTYTLKVAATGADGLRTERTQKFATVKPRNLTMPYLRANESAMLDKGTFGVGQPVIVRFDEPITDKAAAERLLSVTTSPTDVVGGWRWMNSREAHWRPKVYWPAGTKVTVKATVYGKNLGNGLYGQADKTASFTIGRSKIAIADSKTHRMKVYVDGKLVTKINGTDVTAGIPISMGKGGTERSPTGNLIDFTTNSGPHVVTVKSEVYRMTSASYGITDPKSPNFYDEKIKKSIRISGDGEFVHLRDWDTWQIGKANTSHGCINVGTQHIFWFYDNFGAGDVVDVKGTKRQLDVGNGLGDWVLSWDEWRKGSALS